MYKDVIRDSKRHRIRQDNRIDKESGLISENKKQLLSSTDRAE